MPTPPPPELERIVDLYRNGQTLQAYRASLEHGPFREWRGADALVVAGRLAMSLGAPRLGHVFHLRAWRQDRENPRAACYHALALLHQLGPLAAWRFQRRLGDLAQAPPSVRSDWLAARARIHGVFRDFEGAEAALDRAEEIAPDRPWVHVERSHIYHDADRYEESLASARRALELRPLYRPAVQAEAHALDLLGRREEATTRLAETDAVLESAPIGMQLVNLQIEQRRFGEALETLDRVERFCPLLEPDAAQWLAGRRSDAAYGLGDFPRALEEARRAGPGFFEKIAERIAAAPADARRVQLPVAFVRQHHLTCAPATLTAVSRFWSMPAEHLHIAEEICYDGTPHHSERRWAEENGFAAREFRITWESAVALLDRGVPFTFTTVDPGNAHLQAVVGYDSRRGTLLVRDPYVGPITEFSAQETLLHYRSSGPRGMALVPRAQTALFDGLELPDAALYDRTYRVTRALHDHDRAGAVAIVESMAAEAPDHRLTLSARHSLAMYDGRQGEVLAWVEKLLVLFPDDPNLLLARLSLLRELRPREERMALLAELRARPNGDPLFLREYARELKDDARELPRTRNLLREALRRRPQDPESIHMLAGVLWDERRFDEAFELYRFAACTSDRKEELAAAYFVAARYLKRTDEALRFLEDRFRRYGARSGQPARTLAWALEQIDRQPDAHRVREQGLSLRPEDGELLLHVAGACARIGRFDEAAERIAAAEGRAHADDLRRASADLASARGDPARALELWRQVAEGRPLHPAAQAEVARLLAEQHGREASLVHLRAAVTRFPHHYGLRRLVYDRLRGDEPDAAEAALREMIALEPNDAWSRRELAHHLACLRRLTEARAEIEIARRLDPENPSGLAIEGVIFAADGSTREAKESYRESIRLAVDEEFAIIEWLGLCDSLEEKRAALAFVRDEITRQAGTGEAVSAYRRHAGAWLAPNEVLDTLRQVHEARPDLWATWSAVTLQLAETERLDEALAKARAATERFPLIPGAWLDLARVHELRKQRAEETAALQRALEINPGWGAASRRLAGSLERQDRPAEARTILEQAIRRAPLDAACHGQLADILHLLGERDAAIERLELAVRLAPGYVRAWETLAFWCREAGRPARAVELARDLTRRRAGEANSWLVLARLLESPDDAAECLGAVERAIVLEPRSSESYDLKAELLAHRSRYDEALAACRPRPWGDSPPVELRGRAAWVEAQRGRWKEALAGMRAVIREAPRYHWGWTCLADWLRASGDDAEYLNLARELVAQWPRVATSHGYLGDAQLRRDDRRGARLSLESALALDPAYEFAAATLFDLHLTEHRTEAAAEVLTKTPPTVPRSTILARTIRLNAQRTDSDAALAGLRELSVTPDAGEGTIQSATDALVEAGWWTRALATLDSVLDLPETNPEVGGIWVRLCDRHHGCWRYVRRLIRMPAAAPARRTGIAAAVELLGAGLHGWILAYFVYRFRDALRADTEGWGQLGYAYYRLGKHRAVTRWLKDWEQRKGVKPWMLFNLALSLRHLGSTQEAWGIHDHSLGLAETDASTRLHAVWRSLDMGLQGETKRAQELLARVNEEGFEPFYVFLAGILRAMLQVQGAAPQDRSAAFDKARERLATARWNWQGFTRSRLLRRAYCAVVLRIGRDADTRFARLWGYSQWLGH